MDIHIKGWNSLFFDKKDKKKSGHLMGQGMNVTESQSTVQSHY